MSAGSHKSACLEIYRNNKHLREDLDSIMQGELWADEWRLQYVVRVTVEEMTKDEMNTAIVKLMAEMIRANVEAGQWPDSMVFATLRAIGDRKMRRAEMDEVINAWAEQARARRLAIKMAAFK